MIYVFSPIRSLDASVIIAWHHQKKRNSAEVWQNTPQRSYFKKEYGLLKA